MKPSGELIMTDNNKENGDTDIKKKSHTLRPLGKNNIWWPKKHNTQGINRYWDCVFSSEANT